MSSDKVPKMEVLTYISCMDTAYVRGNPSPKQSYKVQYLHVRYLKCLVIQEWKTRDSWYIIDVKFYPHKLGKFGSKPPLTSMIHSTIGNNWDVLGRLVVWIPGFLSENESWIGILECTRFEGPKPLNDPNQQVTITHRIHVWYIYLHLP